MTTGWKQTDKFYYMSDIIRKTRQAGHVARMGKAKNSTKTLVK